MPLPGIVRCLIGLGNRDSSRSTAYLDECGFCQVETRGAAGPRRDLRGAPTGIEARSSRNRG